ncbi:hypothetical protein CCAX7_14600 [Capsulimonas corticalis]|uniref:Prohead serine protease domain-containing protein n=1 Tax=Capsulimonas corticalis TaxID=2219043 RepID=A0A402CZE9_9BACT|nr:HK97 family phage prohead protease [Capsulimonas corticalis]BDI29409.1 hypothetical protein CCAX7_14600 [Capsulimonas corticalis]
MDLLYKTLPAYGVKTLDSAQGIMEAIVAVFDNVDAAGERIKAGAFTQSLERKYPKGVWMHDWMIPVAKTLEAKELLPGDPLLPAELAELGGLYVKGQFNLNTQRGREAFSDLDFGTVDEFSIGYVTRKDSIDSKTQVRDLIVIDLYEWSPVLVGCNPQTALIGVKQTPSGAQSTPADAATAPASVTPAPQSQPALKENNMPQENASLKFDNAWFKLQSKTIKAGDIEVKAQYLGQYIESDMTYEALDTLVNALFYRVFYGCVYGSWDYDDEDGYTRTLLPVEDAVSTLEAACDEFKTFVVATYRALMTGTGESAIAAAKSLQLNFNNPELSSKSLPAGEKLTTHSERVLATVKEFTDRTAAIKALRVQDDRDLSEATKGRLAGHLESMKSACKTVEELLGATPASPAETNDTTELVAAKAPAPTVDELGVGAQVSDNETLSGKELVSADIANSAYARFLELEVDLMDVE